MALGKGLNSLIPIQKKRRFFHIETSSATDNNHSGDKIWQIPLSDIVPNSEQPRKDFSHESLEELISSIKQYGIMQPLIVTEKEDGGYELIAGERRLRAAQMAGFATVPCIVRTATRQEKLELALIENLQRQDLNPIEEAFSFQRLIEEFNLTQQDVADKIGKSRPYVANTMRLLELPDPIKKALIDGKISSGKARALLSLKSEKEQLVMFASMIGEGITVRDVEKAVSRYSPESRKGSVRRDPNISAQEQLIEERLGSKVRITQRGARGQIVIDYYSKEELKRLVEELT
jgi:ParB family chromosome partitioning protein